ncbi:HAD family hydrolase [Emticicia sp. TH156]|uniref:KdsC family phosphatase n=1 Tax=Emticicia sp. TH156 TaxID=2067454 RepID=UPI000C78DA44|nr:3-deoxy-D-manno-octulosonate 8-phosphate phosphatase [Emticicia sp. TH156]PLK46343.1 3-deoxy-D-manno-octulosonate 8-phosphate phosphatase [Emticicia sp. TH156]
MNLKLKSKLRKITTFIFDIDGVLTDSTVLALRGGELARTFNVKDGYAMGKAVRSGYSIAIISGGKEESVRERLSPLGIKDIFLGVRTDQKLSVFDQYLIDNNLTAEQTIYMGDDLPDWEIMKHRKVLSVCPADAVAEIVEVANYRSTKDGGKGAVREIIEMVMKEQGKWMKIF